jgi:hypothetical protein
MKIKLLSTSNSQKYYKKAVSILFDKVNSNLIVTGVMSRIVVTLSRNADVKATAMRRMVTTGHACPYAS